MDTLALATNTKDVVDNFEAHEGLLLTLDNVEVLSNQADFPEILANGKLGPLEVV